MDETWRRIVAVRSTAARAAHVVRRELLPVPAGEEEFLVRCYREILGRDPDRRGLRSNAAALLAGATRGDVVLALVGSDEYVRRAVATARADTDHLSDEEFVRHAYRVLLLRDPDPGGLDHYTGLLASGWSREDVVRQLVASDEHVNRVAGAAYGLPNLRTLRPEAYEDRPDRCGSPVAVFSAGAPPEFDWMERQIIENGYYDKPGIWGSEVNLDKRTMAELVASLSPARVLDFGCASGAVLLALADLGVDGEGVEISPAAARRADARVRARIHVGDLLDVSLPDQYDVVCGFDIYEHLNPNRIDAYLARVAELVAPGGFAVCNIPAFGEDEIFGTVFPRVLPDWDADADADAARDRVFSWLPVDDEGYPYHGHLIWAESSWWVQRWARAGLRRERELELALHQRYGAHLAETSPARRSFYVFSRGGDVARTAALAEAITGTPSALLSADRAAAGEPGATPSHPVE